jgi:hypothetical protein
MNRAILVLCVLGAVSCTGCRSEYRSGGKVGGHRIQIIESRWGQTYGGSRTQTLPDGKQIYTHEGGKLKVQLENKVLNVNGRKYILPNEDDFITVKNGRVEINGRPAQPQDG